MKIYNCIQPNVSEQRDGMLTILGNKIKEIRLRSKMTQENLGDKAGINPKYLGEIERGEKNPTAYVISRLSDALNVPVCEIFSARKCPFK